MFSGIILLIYTLCHSILQVKDLFQQIKINYTALELDKEGKTLLSQMIKRVIIIKEQSQANNRKVKLDV